MDAKTGLELYKMLYMIRSFEERVSTLFSDNEIPGFVHLYLGEEAVATGVCKALEKSDYITSTHRGHGHVLAKGGIPKLMMAELFGKKTGYCKGKGGSMHIADPSIGILGANGIVGGGLPIAVGAAYSASRIRKTRQVAVSFFGDGATNEGTFHESMNMASAMNLPVLFVCENNQFGVSSRIGRVSRETDLAKRSIGYGIKSYSIDGNDVILVYETAESLIKSLRAGEGPFLLVCNTFRYHGHFEGEKVTYWNEGELQSWQEKDPLKKCREFLGKNMNVGESDFASLEKTVADEIDEAVEFARESEYPKPEEALNGLFEEN